MNESGRIAEQHRRAFEGEAWHGSHVYHLLAEVDAARAARKPIPDAHSIWEIALHIRAWEEVALRRLRGETVELSDEEDWPPVTDEGPNAWRAALAALRETHDELNRAIAGFPEARLQELTPGKETTQYHLLHGVIQHGLYHAGQIAVLKKG